MAKKNILAMQRNDDGTTTILRQYPNGTVSTTEMSNEDFDRIMGYAKQSIDDEQAIEADLPADQNMKRDFDIISKKHSDAINPIIEYTKGDYPGYDGESVRMMVDKSYMVTGYPHHPYLPCNILTDDKEGRMIVEVPDAENKSWHATLDRPCLVGSKVGCYGIFVPWTCNAKALYATGQLLMDASENGRKSIQIPFMDGYLSDK